MLLWRFFVYEVLTELLAIPNYKVVGSEISEDRITLDINSTLDAVACPHCRQTSESLHERHRQTVRDLPVSGKPCYLRFVCQTPFLLPQLQQSLL